MRLSDIDIKSYLEQQIIKVEPTPDLAKIHGATIDLTLDNGFVNFRSENVPFINLAGDKEELSKQLNLITSPEKVLADDEYFFLHPGELALGRTEQIISLPNNMIAWLDGRSSLARLGLMVHVTAHRIDPGWSGKIVLEFYNAGPVPLALKPGMTIGAVSFELLSSASSSPYLQRNDSKYKNQTSTISSQIHEDKK